MSSRSIVVQAGGAFFPTTHVVAIKRKERASSQQAIVTACALGDPTEQMLLKLNTFIAPEAGQERRRNSHSGYVMYLFQAVNNEPEYILYT